MPLANVAGGERLAGCRQAKPPLTGWKRLAMSGIESYPLRLGGLVCEADDLDALLDVVRW